MCSVGNPRRAAFRSGVFSRVIPAFVSASLVLVMECDTRGVAGDGLWISTDNRRKDVPSRQKWIMAIPI